MHNESGYIGLQNKPTVSEEKRKSAARIKERGGGEECEKRQSRDKNKNPEGRRAREMESVKKERKSAAAVLRAACVRPTPQSFLTLNPFPAAGGQPLPLALWALE